MFTSPNFKNLIMSDVSEAGDDACQKNANLQPLVEEISWTKHLGVKDECTFAFMGNQGVFE